VFTPVKDGGHTFRSAKFEDPMLYANLMALYFIEHGRSKFKLRE